MIKCIQVLLFKGSVAPVRRKLLKTAHTEERSFHTNSESCNIRLGSLKNQFNSKQIIEIFNHLFFSTHSYKVDFPFSFKN